MMRKLILVTFFAMCLSLTLSICACQKYVKKHEAMVTTLPQIETPTAVVNPIVEFTNEPEPTENATLEISPNPTIAPTHEQTVEPTVIRTPSISKTTVTQTETPTQIVKSTVKTTPTTTIRPTLKPTPSATVRQTAKHTEEPTATPLQGVDHGYYIRYDDYITFGSYPQTEVTDEALKENLTKVAGTTSTWTSYEYCIEKVVSNYMKYKDVVYNGNKYRGVFFTKYRPYLASFSSSLENTMQNTSMINYKTNTIYWFKYEPIKWTILSESNGEAFLLSDIILDSQAFNAKKYADNNYANSEIRSWLNATFYNTAFSNSEREKIKLVTVDNSLASTMDTSNEYVCSDTKDKIFLLSKKEVENTSFEIDKHSGSSYAYSQGLYFSFGREYWWLRTPCNDYSCGARIVNYYRSEYIVYYFDVGYTCYGVVPALRLML